MNALIVGAMAQVIARSAYNVAGVRRDPRLARLIRLGQKMELHND